MTFIEKERCRAINFRRDYLNDPGNGIFLGKEREFVLHNPALNLWEGIREDAIQYFKGNEIPWWNGNAKLPTGHLLSSQVACVNHLYFIRQRQDIATALLRAVDPNIDHAEKVDDGYVEFEFIGEKPYLKEKSFSRGANCTSVDAAMIGVNNSGIKCLFLIEWKYTENYPIEDKYIEKRSKVYDKLITDPTSPFREKTPKSFYFEPFYQMMRQTLLGWKLSSHGDHGCSQFIHVHVVPEGNEEFHKKITSKYLSGETVTKAWISVLERPELYVSISPQKLFEPLIQEKDTRSLLKYLQERYW